MEFRSMKRLRTVCAYVSLAVALTTCGTTYSQEASKRCQYRLGQTLTMHFDGSRPFIEASINQKPIKMLIDTGSDNTVLFQHAAERLGLRLQHSSITNWGIGGESETYIAHVKEAKYGDTVGKDIDLLVIQTHREKNLDGLLGAKFMFQRADMEISIIGRYLKFYKGENCENTLLSYWDHDAAATSFRPATADDPRPIVDVLINGKKFRALIDTGSTSSFIDLSAAQALGMTPASPNVVKSAQGLSGIGAHTATIWIMPFESFEIGGEVIKHPKIKVTDMGEGMRKDVKRLDLNQMLNDEPEMILGVDFLRSHRVLFSLEQKRMYFTYIGGKVFRTSEDDDISWFEAAAAQGDSEAMVALGMTYLNIEKGRRDAARAATYFSKAAEQGNFEARKRLGLLYETGDGVNRDPRRAFDLYRGCADGEDLGCLYSLGRANEYGIGTEKNQAEALNWYKKAAQHDGVRSKAKVGMAYLLGKGVEKNENLASTWLDDTPKEGYSPQYYRTLGQALFEGGLYDRSEAAYRKATEKSPNDQYAAIWLYLVRARLGRDKNPAAALQSAKATWPHDDVWPATIADMFLGHLQPDQAIKLAHNADKRLDNEQTCEANFYGAEWHLIANDQKSARPLLQSAVQSCPGYFIEYEAALAELDHLEAK